MSGIANQSLFQPNVRGPLGKTAVNKAVVASIRTPREHKWFPLFHNGVTIIANKVNYKSGVISVEDYFVVNGCQSITALFDNGASITPDLKILAKFIEVPPESAIAETITRFSNNQNGITARDFKSNHKTQVQIQNLMKESYHGSFFYQVKRGEEKSAGPNEEIIQNSDAGLLIMAFDLKQPWATHRSYQVFEEKHTEVFGHPSITAHKVVMLAVINEVVKSFNGQIKNALFAQYRITTYFLIYVLRLILEQEGIAALVFDSPEIFVSTAALRSKFEQCIGTIMKGLIVDLNYDLQIITANSVDFDYRDSLRDKKWVEEISNGFLKSRIKDTTTGKTETFSAEWERLNSPVVIA